MKLPNADNAFIDDRKLEDYSLNPFHPVGKHKAYLFDKILGINYLDSFWLKFEILSAIKIEAAIATKTNNFGELWQVDFFITRNNRTAKIRTGWIVQFDEDFPRLTTCYIL